MSNSKNAASNYPLKDVPQPHPHDVLCGRGGGTNAHIGNSHWRMLVSANKELYVTLPKRQKMLLSKSIVNAVRSQNPPGRFLQKDSKTDLWYDVGDQRAQEKTSQALREGAPDIRSKLKDGKEDNGGVGAGGRPSSSSVASGDGSVASSSSSSPAKKPQQPYAVAPTYPGVHHPHMPPPQPVVPPYHPTTGGPPVAVPPIPLPEPVPPQGPVPERKRNNSSSRRKNASDHSYDGSGGDGNTNNALDATEVVEPPAGLDQDGGFSFGSIAMTDFEQAKLMNGCSFGTVMSYQNHHPDEQQQQQQQQQQQLQQHHHQPLHHQQRTDHYDQHRHLDHPHDGGVYHDNNHHEQQLQQHHHHQQQHPNQTRVHFDQNQPRYERPTSSDEDVITPLPMNGGVPGGVAPVDGGLEPAGLSFGSVMSISTADVKLEGGGLSFGSMMSYTKDGASAPSAVDGGLEAIGTSFGSLSLATNDRHNLEQSLQADIAAAEASEAQPTFLRAEKSKGSLLECSDTDSEDEHDSQKISYQKSLQWEQMKATLAKEPSMSPQVSRSGSAASNSGAGCGLNSTPLAAGQPGPPPRKHHDFVTTEGPPTGTLQFPTTTFDRDFSQMSAISVGDDLGFGEQIVPPGSIVDDNFDGSGNLKDAFDMPPPPAPVRKQDDNWEPVPYSAY